MPQTMPHFQGDTRAALSAYVPLQGIPDELLDANGEIRPAWRNFIDYFVRMGPDEVNARFAQGDQYLSDSGVYFRHVDGGQSRERPWPLSHVPVLISGSEWAGIEAGLAQRADVLEMVLQDVYGPNRLVAEGWLPPMLLARNPEWKRPMLGVTPRSGKFLHFVSFELGRSPNGQWWVLNDRTQAPSGAGFALENRVATSRIYPDFFHSANINRLAGFFRSFRDQMFSLRGPDATTPSILSPGSHADTYFEHAYTARYLGLSLLEGEDIVVERGRPMVRTISGLKPVDVLWRRIDSSYADPLELDETSRIGTPGLVGAMRQQGVTMMNAIGSGVLEVRALMAFLPRICEVLTGGPLLLPNIATWWCGHAQERAHVRGNMDAMMISPALSTRLPFDPQDTSAIGGKLRTESYQSLQSLIETDAEYLVGQEAVTLSTSPAFVDGALRPRPMTLRVFLARHGDQWVVMPGGYARIGRANDVTALSMHAGGSCADVWVMSDEPTLPDTMLGIQTGHEAVDDERDLPSRAAESLFWLGRYIDRAEFLSRLTRVYGIRQTEHGASDMPLIEYLAGYLRYLGIEPNDNPPAAISAAIHGAARNARRLRDRLSPDGLIAIADLERLVDAPQDGRQLSAHMGEILRQTIGFSGLVRENMYRSAGWRFLSAGRALERAMSTCSLVARLADPTAPPGAVEAALDCTDSKLAHHRRFGFDMSCATVTALLCLDRRNPRSLLHQLEQLKAHLEALPNIQMEDGTLSPLMRAFMTVHTQVAVQTPQSLGPDALLSIRGELGELSDVLSSVYLS